MNEAFFFHAYKNIAITAELPLPNNNENSSLSSPWRKKSPTDINVGWDYL